jgi:Fe-S-cluster containining protein
MSGPKARSRVFSRADQWFDRARAALLEALPCGRGCCRCCIGPFPITVLDLAELQRGLSSLDDPVRRDIETKAHSQRQAMEASFPRLADSPCVDAWTDAEVDALVERFADLPCPALGSDGQCRVYAFRPVTCRTMGIPMDTTGLVEGACEVQTAVPIIRLPSSYRRDEQVLAREEAAAIESLRRAGSAKGEELLLPYGFLADGPSNILP